MAHQPTKIKRNRRIFKTESFNILTLYLDLQYWQSAICMDRFIKLNPMVGSYFIHHVLYTLWLFVNYKLLVRTRNTRYASNANKLNTKQSVKLIIAYKTGHSNPVSTLFNKLNLWEMISRCIMHRLLEIMSQPVKQFSYIISFMLPNLRDED